jgi:hypothetical protein
MEFAKVTRARLGERVRVLLAQLRALGGEGADDAAEGWDDAEVVQPMGLLALPAMTPTLEALFFRDGDESVVVHLLDKGLSRLADMLEGETRLYGVSNPAARVRCMPSGALRLESAGGAYIELTADGDIVIMPGALKSVGVATLPGDLGALNVAAGTDAVALSAVTPVSTRRVKVPAS